MAPCKRWRRIRRLALRVQPACGRGGLHHLADRRDPVRTPVFVDECLRLGVVVELCLGDPSAGVRNPGAAKRTSRQDTDKHPGTAVARLRGYPGALALRGLAQPGRERTWTAARLEAVIATAAMNEAAWRLVREHGVYPQQLAQWRSSATQSLAQPQEQPASAHQTRQDRRRIKELEREVRRKGSPHRSRCWTACSRLSSRSGPSWRRQSEPRSGAPSELSTRLRSRGIARRVALSGARGRHVAALGRRRLGWRSRG